MKELHDEFTHLFRIMLPDIIFFYSVNLIKSVR